MRAKINYGWKNGKFTGVDETKAASFRPSEDQGIFLQKTSKKDRAAKDMGISLILVDAIVLFRLGNVARSSNRIQAVRQKGKVTKEGVDVVPAAAMEAARGESD